MNLSVKLGNRELQLPLIQGGMGVGISLSSLAGAVMKQGGMGVISAAHPGYKKDDFYANSVACNVEAIIEEVQKAKMLSNGQGLCGVNIMVASKDYDTYVDAAVKAGADAIISGAGLPLHLPKLVKNKEILLAPIVSSGRAVSLILKTWDRHYHRLPDFIVVEGSKAGGHLGFKKEDILHGEVASLEMLLQEVLEAVDKHCKKKKRIPVFVAGGIFDKEDIAHFLSLGASGVQMATRFIATEECDAHENFKQAILSAKKDDLILVKSPAGLPGRAVKNTFMQNIMDGASIKPKHCISCMKPCVPSNTPYCISEALIHAVRGEMEEALVFAGSNAYRIHEITTVEKLIHELFSFYDKEEQQ